MAEEAAIYLVEEWGFSQAAATITVNMAATYAISTVASKVFAPNIPQTQDNGVRQQVPPDTTTGIPIVYGASNITKVVANDNNKPSLIIPGKGFLNKVGQYKDYTVEFWAKINSDALDPKRIFGPIASTDGLYIESGFLTLVIGTNFSSNFVGEWYRPMLIHFRVSRNIASVLINGEEVISLPIDTASLELPDEFYNNKSQDWLGFYGYDGLITLDIDCIAIYPYQVAALVAKRRFAYGQAVPSSDNIDSGFNGSSAFIDYPFADYTEIGRAHV